MQIEEPKESKRGAGTILRMNLKEMYIMGGLALAVVLVLAALLFYFIGKNAQVNQAGNVAMVQEIGALRQEQTNTQQFLVSQITYGEERQRVVLFLRDTIYSYWQENREYLVNKKGIPKSKLTIEKAYRLAEINVTTSEIYPEVDALLIAALQFQESRWGLYRTSEAGAIGTNHFMPSTGLLIATAMDLPFSRKMLDDDKVSTGMCAKYLNLMYTLYGSWGESLADYNGGPWSAFYYKTKSPKLNGQTAAYVPEILNRWEAFRERLTVYKADIKAINKEKVKE